MCTHPRAQVTLCQVFPCSPHEVPLYGHLSSSVFSTWSPSESQPPSLALDIIRDVSRGSFPSQVHCSGMEFSFFLILYFAHENHWLPLSRNRLFFCYTHSGHFHWNCKKEEVKFHCPSYLELNNLSGSVVVLSELINSSSFNLSACNLSL